MSPNEPEKTLPAPPAQAEEPKSPGTAPATDSEPPPEIPPGPDNQ